MQSTVYSQFPFDRNIPKPHQFRISLSYGHPGYDEALVRKHGKPLICNCYLEVEGTSDPSVAVLGSSVTH